MHSTFKRKAILREQVNAPQELVFHVKKSVTRIKEKHIFLSAHLWERIIIYSRPGANFLPGTFGAHLTRRCEVWYVFPTRRYYMYIHIIYKHNSVAAVILHCSIGYANSNKCLLAPRISALCCCCCCCFFNIMCYVIIVVVVVFVVGWAV